MLSRRLAFLSALMALAASSVGCTSSGREVVTPQPEPTSGVVLTEQEEPLTTGESPSSEATTLPDLVSAQSIADGGQSVDLEQLHGLPLDAAREWATASGFREIGDETTTVVIFVPFRIVIEADSDGFVVWARAT